MVEPIDEQVTDEFNWVEEEIEKELFIQRWEPDVWQLDQRLLLSLVKGSIWNAVSSSKVEVDAN